MLIVFGGTLGAVMLQSPMPVFLAGMRMSVWVFFPPSIDPLKLISDVGHWSQVARKEGLLALEEQIPSVPDPFARKGLQLLVDGAEPDRLREVLDVEIGAYEAHLKLSSKIWESAGGYSPTIGIIGAVMGLIHVMENLADPAKLGSAIWFFSRSPRNSWRTFRFWSSSVKCWSMAWWGSQMATIRGLWKVVCKDTWPDGRLPSSPTPRGR
jgi:flagellar motor component MotA